MCGRWATLVLACVLGASAWASEPKHAVPDAAAQKRSLAIVTDVYKSDYEKAKSLPQKIALAKKMLTDGAATKEPVSRFVLFRVARDIAAQQGDLVTAFDAIAQMEADFDTDPLQMKVDAANVAVKALKTPKEQQACAVLLGAAVDEAMAADRYDSAKSLAALALGAARESRDVDLIKQMTTRSGEMEGIAAEFGKVKEAKAVLDSKPTDPAANFAVGKFLCLAKNDWQFGISMLALGTDGEFKTAAQLELADKPDSLKLGDAWWKIAEGLEGTAKSRAQAHAAQWYRKALPTQTGLAKVRIERLIQQAPTSPAGPTAVLTRKSPLQVREELANAMAAAKSQEELIRHVDAAIELMTQAIAEERLSDAVRLGQIGSLAAARANSTTLAKKITKQLAAIASGSTNTAVTASQTWKNAVPVKKGDVIVVVANGKWHTWPGGGADWETGADGTKFNAEEDSFPLRGAPQGALVGRIGERVMLLGSMQVIDVEEDGVLELIDNDDHRRFDNQGSINVSITTFRKK